MKDKIITYQSKGKLRTVVWSCEAQALKRLRISKKITRLEAAKVFESGPWYIERLENGRLRINENHIRKLLRRYNTSRDEFSKIINGKIIIEDLPARSIHKKIGSGRYVRRFDKKVITKEARVLKSLRLMSKLSQQQAGNLCGMHRKSIAHIEHGRVDITEGRLTQLLKAYRVSKEEYLNLIGEDVLRDEVIRECHNILESISSDKLKAVSALLTNFK